jgi:hypothetical protein
VGHRWNGHVEFGIQLDVTAGARRGRIVQPDSGKNSQKAQGRAFLRSAPAAKTTGGSSQLALARAPLSGNQLLLGVGSSVL